MGLILIILTVLLSPAIIMVVIGASLKKKKPKMAKVLFILATVYVIIGLGFCGNLLSVGF
jgi:hypothetical protein